MFTGIVECIAPIEVVEMTSRGKKMQIGYRDKMDPVREGESIAIDGVCLTVSAVAETSFTVEVVHQTLNATTLSNIERGCKVNLERSLKIGDRVGGHFVFGHVDAVCTLRKIVKTDEEFLLEIEIPEALSLHIVEKGSIAIDGISLTIQSVTDQTFTVAVIPYTAKHTTLGEKKECARVNLELDMLAKYAQQSQRKDSEFPFSTESLRELGF